MSDARRRILDLLAEGKITVTEAERLLNTIEPEPSASERPNLVSETPNPVSKARFLRIVVAESQDNVAVNIRVPLRLLRSGMRLASFIPKEALDKIQEKSGGQIPFDLAKIDPDAIEDLVQSLSELTLDVNGDSGEQVRIFCE